MAISQLLKSISHYAIPYRKQLLIIAIGLLMEMTFIASVPMSMRFIIDEALIKQNKPALFTVLIGLGFGAILVASVGLYRDFLYARFSASISRDIRERMFQHLQSLTNNFYASSQTGDIVSHFSGDVAAVESATVAAIPWGILPSLDVLASTFLLFLLDWRLALLAMLVYPLSLIGPRLFVPQATQESYKRREAEGAVLANVQENIYANALVKSFQLEELRLGLFQQFNNHLWNVMRRASFLGALVERSAGIAVMILQVVILGAGSLMVLENMISIGTLASFQALFLSLSASITYVSQYTQSLVTASAGMQRINELFENTPGVDDSDDSLRRSIPTLRQEITFDQVTFSYTGEQKNLDQVSLTIPSGKYVSFVGSSGSGKSTILNLVMRFYDATNGAVCIDGMDIRHGSLASLRAQMGIVFQESFLFDLSVRDNIRVGKPDASDAEIETAAQKAEIHDMIMAMPQGYDTPVGEGGSNLSGGQRQRIAIARAILRNPAILILDEATSALDPATEAAINSTLETLAKGRTTLSVTHRLASVVKSDIIYVLHKGKIAEFGSHEALLKNQGIYRRLWERQHGISLTDDGKHASITKEWLRRLDIFAKLSDQTLDDISSRFVTETYPVERTVFYEGDPGEKFYIIARGAVDVLKTEPMSNATVLPKNYARKGFTGNRDQEYKKIATLRDGDYFGEISLLSNVLRTATIRTTMPTIFLVLFKEDFNFVMAKSPESAGILNDSRVKRLAELE